MTGRPRAGRVLSAVAFLVLGAGTVMLLPDDRPAPASAAASPSPADIGFAQDMIVHHQQAVTMAQSVRGRAGPQVAQLAMSIELNQTREIGHMQGWLALWRAPQVPSGPPMTWMKDGHHGHAAGDMPGMASQQEIASLGEAKGKDLDIRFLELMIRHHEGAIPMASAASARASVPHVRATAALMISDQRKETAVMTGLLAALRSD